MKFKKTYSVEVEIDLDAAEGDVEWAVENWECNELMDFCHQVYNDVDDFVAGGRVNG